MTLPLPPPPQQLDPIAERAHSMQSTVYGFAEVWTRQGCCNLHHVARWPSVAKLDGAFEGVPAVILSPGPSLPRNIERVRELKGRAVLISYGRTLHKLRDHGIVPDIAVALDPLDLVYHYDGYDVSQLEAFVVGATCNPELFNRPWRRVFPFSGNQMIESWIYNALPEGESMWLDTSCSVATTSLSLARKMGCSPIVLVGQDLSFEGGRYYASGTADGAARLEAIPKPTDEQVRDEDGRLRTLWELAKHGDPHANAAIQRLYNERNQREKGAQVVGLSDKAKSVEASGKAVLSRIGEVKHVPGYYGGRVRATPSFTWVREWIGKRAAEMEGQIINATEGGCYIDNCVHAELSVVLDGGVSKLGTQVRAELDPLSTAPVDVGERLGAVVDALDVEDQRAALHDMARDHRDALRKASKYASKIRHAVARSPRRAWEVRRITTWDTRMREALQPAAMFTATYQQQVIDAIYDQALPEGTMMGALEKLAMTAEVVGHAAEFGVPLFEDAMRRIESDAEKDQEDHRTG